MRSFWLRALGAGVLAAIGAACLLLAAAGAMLLVAGPPVEAMRTPDALGKVVGLVGLTALLAVGSASLWASRRLLRVGSAARTGSEAPRGTT